MHDIEQMRTPNWPRMIPPDLRSRLEALLGTRNRPLAADVWTELRDWLISHEAEPPGNLPEEKRSEGPAKSRL